MKNILLFTLFMFASTCAHADQKYIYLGDGRSTCEGDNCERYNLRQERANRDREESRQRDREYRREYDRTIIESNHDEYSYDDYYR